MYDFENTPVQAGGFAAAAPASERLNTPIAPLPLAIRRLSATAAVWLACGAWLPSGVATAQTQIRVDVRLVNVAFSVRDAAGNLVTNLGRDDFDVTEDGVPQAISFFAHSTDVPLDVGFLVDFSGSQGSSIKAHHEALAQFMKTVLTPRDRAFLVGFTRSPHQLTELTASSKEITAALQNFEHSKNRGAFPLLGPSETRAGCGGTAFYDAVHYSIAQVLEPLEQGRRALLIFSDGEDNDSAKTEFDAVETAQNANTVLYCLRYTETLAGKLTARNKYGTSVMQRMARDTGGEEFDAQAVSLDENFRRIAEQLRSSYEIAYHSTNPANDGSFHKLVIRAKQPDLAVRTKTGYYAR